MALLLCDLDETLLDRTSTLRRWVVDLVHDHGIDPGEVDDIMALDRHGAASRPEFLAEINRRFDIEPPITEAAYEATYAPLFRAEPEVRSALISARAQGWTIAIVTNGYAIQGHKIAAAGLTRLVDVVCISDIEGSWKPDPGLLEAASRRTSTSLDGAWMVGDDPDADIGAATAAGVASAWVRKGRTWPRTDYRPTAEVDSFAEAVDLVLSR